MRIKELLLHTKQGRMNLTNTVLGERGQTGKLTYNMIPFYKVPRQIKLIYDVRS